MDDRRLRHGKAASPGEGWAAITVPKIRLGG